MRSRPVELFTDNYEGTSNHTRGLHCTALYSTAKLLLGALVLLILHKKWRLTVVRTSVYSDLKLKRNHRFKNAMTAFPFSDIICSFCFFILVNKILMCKTINNELLRMIWDYLCVTLHITWNLNCLFSVNWARPKVARNTVTFSASLQGTLRNWVALAAPLSHRMPNPSDYPFVPFGHLVVKGLWNFIAELNWEEKNTTKT